MSGTYPAIAAQIFSGRGHAFCLGLQPQRSTPKALGSKFCTHQAPVVLLSLNL